MTLIRKEYNSWGIISELKGGDTFSWVTLEHAYLQDGGCYLPKIPKGTFTCVKGTHELLTGGPFTTFEITGVPSHTGLLFHIGNFNNDSEGCILLGNQLNEITQSILNSRIAFNEFMIAQNGSDKFKLTVM